LCIAFVNQTGIWGSVEGELIAEISNLTILGIASANLYVLGKDILKAGVWLNFSQPNTSL